MALEIRYAVGGFAIQQREMFASKAPFTTGPLQVFQGGWKFVFRVYFYWTQPGTSSLTLNQNKNALSFDKALKIDLLSTCCTNITSDCDANKSTVEYKNAHLFRVHFLDTYILGEGQ